MVILSTILEIEIAIVLQISHLQRQLMNVYMKSDLNFALLLFILCIFLSAERGKLMYPNRFHDDGIAQKKTLTQWQQFKAVNSIVSHIHTHNAHQFTQPSLDDTVFTSHLSLHRDGRFEMDFVLISILFCKRVHACISSWIILGSYIYMPI